MKIICDNEEISEDFIFMHDDIFILKPLKEVPYYYRGTLEEHVEAIFEKVWRKYVLQKYRLCPWKVSKRKKLWCPYADCVQQEKSWNIYWKNTAFMNEVKEVCIVIIGKSREKQYPKWDCKLYTDLDKLDLEQEFMSVDDKVGTSKKFLELIEELFPTRSKYEVLDFYYFKMKKVQVKLHKSLYPYRNGDIVEMKFEVAEKMGKRKVI